MAGYPEDYEDETHPPELDEFEGVPDDFFDGPDEDDEPDQFRDDVEADADALRSAGWGTDEDYGGEADCPW